MDKRLLQNLKDDVAEARAAVTEAQLVLHAAEGALISAEREMNRAAKLTPAMKTALVVLADGGVLRKSEFNYPHRYWITPKDGDPSTIRSSVFDGLRSREMLGSGITDGVCLCRFELTDHGRAVAKGQS